MKSRARTLCALAGKTESTASKNKLLLVLESGREGKYMNVDKSDILNAGLKEKARNKIMMD